jgi:hypothetical protein
VTRRTLRVLGLLVGVGLEGAGIYYVILAGYLLIVAAGVWLMSRPAWFAVLAGWVVLLDGMLSSLFLLYRWSMRCSEKAQPRP